MNENNFNEEPVLQPIDSNVVPPVQNNTVVSPVPDNTVVQPVPETPMVQPVPEQVNTTPVVEPTVQSVIEPTVQPVVEQVNVTPVVQPVMDNSMSMNNNTNTDTDNNVNNSNNLDDLSDEFVDKKGKKKNKLLITIILLILACVCGGVGYFYFGVIRNPLVIARNSVATLFKEADTIKESAKEYVSFDLSKDIVRSNGSITLKGSSTVEGLDLSKLNGNKINYDMILNAKDHELSFDGGVVDSNKTIATISTFLKDKKMYLKSNEILPKIYYSEFEDDSFFDELFDSSIKADVVGDLDIILPKMNKYISDSIKKDYVSQESGTYDIAGTSIKGYKNNIHIDSSTFNEMSNYVVNKMLDDDELINALVDLTGNKKEDIVTGLNEFLEDVKDNSVNLDINTYTNNFGKVLGFEIIEKDTTTVSGVIDNGVTTIKIPVYESEYTIVIDGNKATIKDGSDMTVEVTWDKGSISVSIISVQLSSTFTLSTKVTDGVSNVNLNVKLDYVEPEAGKINLDITFDNNTSKVNEISKFDTTNSVNADLMTEDDENTILNNFNNAISGTVYEDLMNIASSYLEESYDYDDELYYE